MTLSAVQTTFYDTFGPGFPGQLADYGSDTLSTGVKSYVAESSVNDANLVVGRAVVKGAAVAQGDPVTTPFKVKAIAAASVVADLVGIYVRHELTTQNASNDAVPVRIPTMLPIAENNGDAETIIYAKVPAGITIADGDPVYVSVSHATIPPGEFSNAAAAGLIGPWTGATWYGAAAASTVGRIRL